MPRAMGLATALLALAALAGQIARADDGPSAQVMTKASASVVQIIARNCSSGDRTGSGFVWENPAELVTALHVVAGCQNLYAYFPGVGEKPASLIHALSNADLAALSVQSPPGTAPLQPAATTPAVNDKLEVIGFYFGVPTLDSRPLEVTLGSPVLRDMVPDDVRQRLQAAGSPSLDTQILRLDGNLLPGLSGAPLIDSSGGVVGVGSGGLEDGTVGVSWAIQSHYLADLDGAPAETTLAPPSGVLFSAPAAGEDASKIRCGDLDFVFIKKRSFQELLATTDDVVGLGQLARTAGLPDQEIRAIEFDVYAEQNSGASLVLLTGSELVAGGDMCRADIADGVTVEVGSRQVGNLYQAQNVALNFDSAFDRRGLYWVPDQSFTYTAPETRADGLVVMRKNYLGYATAYALSGDAFETLMTRRNAFVAVRAVNAHFNPPLYQRCNLAPQSYGCDQTIPIFRQWATAVLGAQMSTFPPN